MMYTIDEIKEIINALDNSSVTEVELTCGNGEKIKLKKKSEVKVVAAEPIEVPAAPMVIPAAPAAPTAPAVPAAEAAPVAEGKEIKSPMVGVFYAAASPDSDPYVQVGQAVKKGDTLCIIEAMKLMNEINAEESGVITEICVKNGDLVQFGQPLFKIK
ncbi:acetyl-CoA carboxylase biotin carboxyl carrier protein [Anaeromassilibacillus sp. An172]|uniref:acetyl-CoA carboxylase biotin carboxyl carrier protein n=1 Tax=Anaeromassilibacillus sp. An172 TaxID=1965570 RepID=UPI001951C5C0|nr:acetyl-CoA carboxylase biotin carboxyl carrier protein [Anaeromassilibacillus sp. An172]